MNRSALRNMLKVVGIIMVVMLPVMLALWFAQLRAVSEISAQLRTFAELALNKTERVIQQVDLAREDAEKYQGKVCTPEHRQYMLNVSRGGNDSNLLIVFYVQIMPDDFVMQLHRF